MTSPTAIWYDVLGVTPSDDTATIKRAYRRLAHDYHPDRGGDPAQMATLNTAYRTLSDPLTRHAYDQELAAPEPDDPPLEDPEPDDSWGTEVVDETIQDPFPGQNPPPPGPAPGPPPSGRPNPFPWEHGYQTPTEEPPGAGYATSSSAGWARPTSLVWTLLALLGALSLLTIAVTVYGLTQGDSSPTDLTIWLVLLALAGVLAYRRLSGRSTVGYVVFVGVLILATIAAASTNVPGAVYCAAWIAAYVGATEVYHRQH